MRTLLKLLMISFLFVSCKDYLEVKPNQKLVIPANLKDLQAVNDGGTNNLFPAGMDNASDDYFLPEIIYNGIRDAEARNMYIWDEQAQSDFDWQYQYKMIFDANLVLDLVDELPANGLLDVDRNQIKGAALFKRADAHFNVLVEYALSYDGDLNTKLGIPLRRSSSINEEIKRSSLKEGFEMVIQDLIHAVELLPPIALVKTRPGKTAAYGLLARVYLYQHNYEQALASVNEAFKLGVPLIDYNTVSSNATIPFSQFNEETLFYAISSGRGGMLSPSRAMVQPELYQTYQPDDLRKVIFYKTVSGGYAFKGDYSGQSAGRLFFGIASDELYLMKAECEVRLGQKIEAMATLNSLLLKRYRNGKYVRISNSLSIEELLSLILLERRKELAFRGMLRWMDFKRLKVDAVNRFEMKRLLGNKTYDIKPEDLKTAYLIPDLVVKLSGVAQNKR